MKMKTRCNVKQWELEAIENLQKILGRLNTEDLSNSKRIEQLRHNISMMQSKVESK